MHITTVHTLTFTMTTSGTEQSTAAAAIIKGGTTSLGLVAEMRAAPMPDGADPSIRTTSVQVMSDDHDKCVQFWDELARALAFIGVEATSP